jgi:hypothetical protein
MPLTDGPPIFPEEFIEAGAPGASRRRNFRATILFRVTRADPTGGGMARHITTPRTQTSEIPAVRSVTAKSSPKSLRHSEKGSSAQPPLRLRPELSASSLDIGTPLWYSGPSPLEPLPPISRFVRCSRTMAELHLTLNPTTEVRA